MGSKMNESQEKMLKRICDLAKEFFELYNGELVTESGLPIRSFFINYPTMDAVKPTVSVTRGLPKLAEMVEIEPTDGQKRWTADDPSIEIVYDGVVFRQSATRVGEYKYD